MTKRGSIAIGPLSTKAAGKHYIPVSVSFADVDIPIRNASSKQPLELGKVWSSAPRPGSLDFKQWPSKGGC